MFVLLRGHTDAVMVVLEADPSIEHVRMADIEGQTALMYASTGGGQQGRRVGAA